MVDDDAELPRDSAEAKLIARLSHDLRTPLGAASNATAVLRRQLKSLGGALPAEAKQSLASLEKQLAAIRDTLDEILDGSKRRETPTPSSPQQHEGALSVMIVEDDPDNCEMLAMFLEQLGSRTSKATDGEAGLEMILNDPPALAFIDLGLPKLNGLDVAKQIRKAIGQQVYLVALTGYGSEADVKEALSAGFNEHITKPIEPAKIEALLRELSAA